jgi:hypothetical protein
MATGEHCYISITRKGMVIKESDLGLLGRNVVRIDSVDDLAFMAMKLSECEYPDITPPTMTNPVLKVITNRILHLECLDDVEEIFGRWDTRNK